MENDLESFHSMIKSDRTQIINRLEDNYIDFSLEIPNELNKILLVDD